MTPPETGPVAKGKWVAREPIDRPETVGFHLPSWYSPLFPCHLLWLRFCRGFTIPTATWPL